MSDVSGSDESHGCQHCSAETMVTASYCSACGRPLATTGVKSQELAAPSSDTQGSGHSQPKPWEADYWASGPESKRTCSSETESRIREASVLPELRDRGHRWCIVLRKVWPFAF